MRHLAAIIFLLLSAGRAFADLDGASLAKVITDPRSTFEQRWDAAERLDKLPAEQALPAILGVTGPGPADAKYRATGVDLDNPDQIRRETPEWQAEWLADKVWERHMDEPGVSEVLAKLLTKANTREQQFRIIPDMRFHWCAAAEAPLARRFRDPATDPWMRIQMGQILFERAEKRYHDEVRAIAEHGPLEDRRFLFHVLTERFDPDAKVDPDPKVIALGLELMEEECRASGRGDAGGRLIADQIGQYVGQNFSPDATELRYKNEHYPDDAAKTVRSARAWWKQNRSHFPAASGPS